MAERQVLLDAINREIDLGDVAMRGKQIHHIVVGGGGRKVFQI
jgi:hypothetical protein